MINRQNIIEYESIKQKKIVRVLSIHWGLVPGGVAVYGRYIENVRHFAPVHLKSLCINSPAWPLDKANTAHMEIHFIKIKGRSDFSWLLKVRAYIKGESPDIIMTHGFNSAFVAFFATIGLSIPIVSSWHGDYYPSTIYQKISKPVIDTLLKILFRHVVREIVTVSNFAKRALVEKKISEKKITVIHNGIAPEPLVYDHVKSIRKELKVHDGQLLVGTACRLSSQKGLEWFLRAIAIVVKKQNDIRFVLWGDGPQLRYLQGIAKELGITDYIKMPGYRSDINHCLPALDIFCMSSYAEYFSIALLEAMRAERPIVATRVGGNPEAIEDGIHGVLVPFGEPEAMARAILMLANNQILRKQLAANAKQRFLDEFTSEKMIEKSALWILNTVCRDSLN